MSSPPNQPQPRHSTRRLRRVLGRLALWLIALTLSVSAVLMLLQHPDSAVLALAAGCLVLAVLRVTFPGRPWFASRSRVADTLALVLTAALLAHLAPWTQIAAL